jgi:hypothetical protein
LAGVASGVPGGFVTGESVTPLYGTGVTGRLLVPDSFWADSNTGIPWMTASLLYGSISSGEPYYVTYANSIPETPSFDSGFDSGFDSPFAYLSDVMWVESKVACANATGVVTGILISSGTPAFNHEYANYTVLDLTGVTVTGHSVMNLLNNASGPTYFYDNGFVFSKSVAEQYAFDSFLFTGSPFQQAGFSNGPSHELYNGVVMSLGPVVVDSINNTGYDLINQGAITVPSGPSPSKLNVFVGTETQFSSGSHTLFVSGRALVESPYNRVLDSGQHTWPMQGDYMLYDGAGMTYGIMDDFFPQGF